MRTKKFSGKFFLRQVSVLTCTLANSIVLLPQYFLESYLLRQDRVIKSTIELNNNEFEKYLSIYIENTKRNALQTASKGVKQNNRFVNFSQTETLKTYNVI